MKPEMTLEAKARTVFRRVSILSVFIHLLPCFAMSVFAAGPTESLEAFVDLFVSLIKIAGFVAGLWGLIQVAVSFSSHDPSQRINGIMFFIGGLLVYFADAILAQIGVVI